MAVFPDRIVLKNSTDSQAAIEAAIEAGGTDEITQGEIVLGISSSAVQLYTKAGDGSIVTIANAGSFALINDPNPTLGASLDTNGYYIASTSGDVQIAPYNAELTIRGTGSTSGRLTLNCSSNSHGVTIQSPPHSAGATYTLVLPEDTGTAGQVLSTDGSGDLSWVDGGGSSSYTDPLTTDGDIVIRASGSTTRLGIGSEGQVLSVSSGLPAWEDPTGGGGGSIAGTVLKKSETQTTTGGLATFTELGASGLLVSVSSVADAWVVLYATEAARTADATRFYGTDPTPGTGVLAEFFVTAGGTILASPGTTYFNNDAVASDAIYAAVRDELGANVVTDVTIKAYVHQNFGGVGTNRITDSGTASSGELTLEGMGQSGQFCTVTSSLDAWIVFYGSAADRTADSSRTFTTDPTPGSGVQAEFYVPAGTTVVATPGSTYYNNDIAPAEAIYLAVRDTAGAAVDSLVTVKAYAETNHDGGGGGIEEAPEDGTPYARQDASWVSVTSGGGGSDRIQDMDDFELTQQAGLLVLPNKVALGSMDSDSLVGDWTIFNTGSQFYFSALQTILIDNLSNGDEITMQVPGMAEPFTTTLTSDPTSSSGGYYFDLSPNAPAEINGAVDGTSLTITSPNLPGSPIPLLEGDTLQWNSTDQVFSPAQVVDSVNGETGVVLLGVQDMDDFALNDQVNSFVATYTVTNSSVSAGKIRRIGPGGYTVNTSINGLDPLVIYQTGDTIWMQSDTETSAQMTITGASDQGGGIVYLTTDIDFALGSSGWNLTVYSYDPTGGAPKQPLTDGDLLQWNSDANEFRPTSDYISLTSLKAEVAASADFADFQSRIAAL